MRCSVFRAIHVTMSIKAVTNISKFTSVATNQRLLRNNEDCRPVEMINRNTDKLSDKPVEMIKSNTEELSVKESFKEMSIKEEKNHKLTSLKPKKSKIRSMYKHQYVDGKGGVIILRAASVSLHIPAGALSERTLVSIEVKSATDRTMSDLDQSSSLTPIVSCQPDGQKFKKPVELIVPHCAEFDDISLHKATVQIHEGNISVAKETNSPHDNVRCVLKERYCHIYTTHFSDVEVGISNCLKKRMLVVPFSRGNNKLYVNVWIINDLPSEYTILLHEQENLKFAPFDQTGKFIFENYGQCSLKVQSSINGVNLTENVQVLDIQQLVTNIRNLYYFEIEKQVTDTSPHAVTVSLLKEPVLYLREEIRGVNVVESCQDETCTSDENETIFDEGSHIESDNPSFDIPQKIATFQTDIFQTIRTIIADIFLTITALTKEGLEDPFKKGYHPQKKVNLWTDCSTKVTALHPALFKIISSFSGDIFWELSPDERELIKGISSFNEDILQTTTTTQTDIYAVLLSDSFRDPYYYTEHRRNLTSVRKDTITKMVAFQTDVLKRISSFNEDFLKMPQLLPADLFHTVSTLEIDIFTKSTVLQKDLFNKTESLVEDLRRGCGRSGLFDVYVPFFYGSGDTLETFNEDIRQKQATFETDIFTKITALKTDSVQRISSFLEDLLTRSFSRLERDIHQEIENLERDISTKVKAFLADLVKKVSSFNKDLIHLILSFIEDYISSSRRYKGDFFKRPPTFYTDAFTKIKAYQTDLFEEISSFLKDFEKTKSPLFNEDILQIISSTEQELEKKIETFNKESQTKSSFFYHEPKEKLQIPSKELQKKPQSSSEEFLRKSRSFYHEPEEKMQIASKELQKKPQSSGKASWQDWLFGKDTK